MEPCGGPLLMRVGVPSPALEPELLRSWAGGGRVGVGYWTWKVGTTKYVCWDCWERILF